MNLPQLLPEEDLQATYQNMVSYTRGLLDKLGILPYIDQLSNVDPAYTTALGSLAGPAPPRLGTLVDRHRALRMSPLWETMPRDQQLQLLRGQNTPRSPELTQTVQDMMRVRSDSPVPGLHSMHQEPVRLSWLQDLLKGGQKP